MSLDFSIESAPMPHVCSECGNNSERRHEVFWRNITHNLAEMAGEAGIYKVLWHPNENGKIYAKDIIPELKAGLSDLLNRPAHFRHFNAQNGWGLYEHFVPFVEAVLTACEANPDGMLRVSI